jgi:hypothetical protein
MLDTEAFTFTAGVTYSLRVVAVGNAIELFVDGASVLTATTTQFQTETRVGFRVNDAAVDSRYDNLSVVAP